VGRRLSLDVLENGKVTCPGQTSTHSSTADQPTPQSLVPDRHRPTVPRLTSLHHSHHTVHTVVSQDRRRSRRRRGVKLLEPPEENTTVLANNLPIDKA